MPNKKRIAPAISGEIPGSSEIADKETLLKELEQLRQENERLKLAKAENERLLQEAIVDSITGLGKGNFLFQTLELELKKVGIDKQIVENLENINPEEFADLPIYAMMGDVAYLSLANNLGGHAAGNQLLRSIGLSARAIGSPEKIILPQQDDLSDEFVAYRHGGDEISAIIRAKTKAEARQKVNEFKQAISQTDLEVLKRNGLQPRLDTGISHISEAVRALKKMNSQEAIEPEHRLKILLNTMLEIADRRASLSKGVMRLEEVIEIYLEKAQSDPDGYQELMGYLRKATFGTKDSEIAELAKAQKSLPKDQWRKKAMEHIREKVKIFQEHEAQVEQDHMEIINEIADVGMEESS